MTSRTIYLLLLAGVGLAELSTYIKTEFEKWGAVVVNAGIKGE